MLNNFKKDLPGAVEALTKAIELDPKYARAIKYRGFLRYLNHQYGLARQDLDLSIKLEPDAESYSLRGQVYLALKQHNKAIEELNRAIKLDPKHADAYHVKGLVLVRLGRVQEAIGSYTKAIELEPTPQHYNNRGVAYLRLKRYAEARRDIRKALQLDPRFPNAHNSLGVYYEWVGRKKEAREEYDIAVSLLPNELGFRFSRGALLAGEGKLDEAMLDVQKIKRGQRTGEEPAASAYQFTVKDCTKMIRLHSDNLEFIYDRGLAYFALADWPSALADFEMFRTVSATGSRTALNAAIFSNFAYRRLSLNREASLPIKRVLGRTTIPEQYWAYRFVEYLSGNAVSLALALQDENLGLVSKTSLKCYLGIDRAIAGDIAAAKAQFNWVKDYGDRNIDEFDLAMTELARLNNQANAN